MITVQKLQFRLSLHVAAFRFCPIYATIPQMNVLCTDNLVYSYPAALARAVDGVSFSLAAGSYTALAGKNGSGKSTVARIIAGLLEADSGTVSSCNMRAALVFQSPKDQIICGTLMRDTAFGPACMRLSASEAELRTIESLNFTRMLEHAEKNCFSLSLGQLQKAAISGMLALSCDILILDEALAMIDAAARDDFFALFDSLHKKGMTILHITHDAEAARRAERVMVMDAGKIIWDGSADSFFLQRELLDGITGGPLPPSARRPFKRKNVQKTFSMHQIRAIRSGQTILKDISFDLYGGSLTALTGSSGSGKTTLLEIAAGLLRPQGGAVYAKEKAALVQQNPDAALFEPFAADDVAFGAKNSGMTGQQLVERVKAAMETAGLPFEEFADRQTFSLSGGEKRRLAIAGILAVESSIILFDEPTAGLDGHARHRIMNMMRALAEQGKTVLYSTHRRDEADFADRILHLANGAIAADTFSDFPTVSKEHLPPLDAKANQPESAADLPLTRQDAFGWADTLLTLQEYAGALHGRKRTIFTKLPPALKYVLFAALFFGALTATAVPLGAGILALCTVYALLSGCPAKKLFLMMLKIIPYLSFFCIFQMLFVRPDALERIYWSWRFITVTPSKLQSCLFVLLRTESALCSISAFRSSMTEQEIITGFETLLLPLKKLHVPVRYASVMVEIIFRFIPLLLDEAICIIKTQLVRGGLKNSGGIIAKIRAAFPLFVPLILRTLRRAEALADALTIRGFK